MMNPYKLMTLMMLALAGFSGAPKATEPAVTVRPAPVREVENAEQVPWLAERRLTWGDFLSEPRRGTTAIAMASTTLSIAYQMKNGELSYEISCNFSKTQSWGLVRTAYILAHEQGHFDITEIFARKLHQRLLQHSFGYQTYKEDLTRIYRETVAEKEAMQVAYDGQTDHSRNQEAQAAWLQKIDQMLTDLEPYSDYP